MSYESTKQQISKELGGMYQKMRDPEVHEKKDLENKHKKNVEKSTKRYGLD